MQKIGILVGYVLIGLYSNAQFNFVYDDSIPVKNGLNFKEMPWAGGLSYAQFSDFDFDFDGDLDLFVFDKSSDNIRVFLQEEREDGEKYYKFKQNAQEAFPSNISYRATMVDYDNDGRKDLFCYGIGGLRVYRNVGDLVNGLQWTLAKDLLYSDHSGSNMALYVSSIDIPAIADIDGDGDIDILTFHIGGQHLQYHKNLSMENYGVPDSLEFILKNSCWGGFREDINSNSLFLFDTTPPCTNGNVTDPEGPIFDGEIRRDPITEQTPKHSGSTILAIDIDNSGVMDLIIGDAAFGNLNLLINGGSAPNMNSSIISVDPLFPSDGIPVALEVFPAAFFLDVDFDGIKDIIVGANAKSSSANESSILFYKNTGTNILPEFTFVTDAFLQQEMIEHGTGTMPVVVDINNDGLEDLFIANFFRHKPMSLKESTIAFYENSGSATEPEFTLIDANFLDLNLETYGLRMVPTFGDVDGDGLKDLFLGLENGSLVFYKNTSMLPSITFAAPIINFTDNLGDVISAGQYAAPQLFDLNNDGLLDLIIGKKTGELMYYENVGTSTAPSFQLTNSMLGNIDIATTSPEGYAYPHFFRLEDTTYLFLGGVSGKLIYYENIDDNLAFGSSFELVSNEYVNISSGSNSSFFTSDIDSDGEMNLFVGQDLGGIQHFENDPSSSVGMKEIFNNLNVSVYPNPANQYVTVSSEIAGDLYLSIFDLFGKEMQSPKQFHQITQIDVSDFANGIYVFVISNGDAEKSTIKRVVKN